MGQHIKEEIFGLTAEVMDEVCENTGLDLEDIIELHDDFFAELSAKFEEALVSEQTGDENALKRFGHSIKGSAGQVGLIPIQKMGFEMENIALTDREKWFELAHQVLDLAKTWKNCNI